MANREHARKLREGVELWNQWRDASSPDLVPDLRGEALSGIGLTGANLSDADFSGAALLRAELTADLRRANLIEAKLAGADLRGADLTGAYLSIADLRGANFSGASLLDANLRGADLRNATLVDADLRGACLAGADLDGADLRRADLNRADLTGANLSKSNLSKANISRANLSRAELCNALLDDTRLCESELSDADFIGAIINRTDFTGAKLVRTNFTQADLNRVNFNDANLQYAVFEDTALIDARINDANLEDVRYHWTIVDDEVIQRNLRWQPAPQKSPRLDKHAGHDPTGDYRYVYENHRMDVAFKFSAEASPIHCPVNVEIALPDESTGNGIGAGVTNAIAGLFESYGFYCAAHSRSTSNYFRKKLLFGSLIDLDNDAFIETLDTLKEQMSRVFYPAGDNESLTAELSRAMTGVQNGVIRVANSLGIKYTKQNENTLLHLELKDAHVDHINANPNILRHPNAVLVDLYCVNAEIRVSQPPV